MAGAFAAGEADYTTAFEPTATSLAKEGAGYIVASVGQDAGEIPFTCYIATKSYMDKNSDLIQRFTNALYKGQQWVQQASDEEIAKAMKLDKLAAPLGKFRQGLSKRIDDVVAYGLDKADDLSTLT